MNIEADPPSDPHINGGIDVRSSDVDCHIYLAQGIKCSIFTVFVPDYSEDSGAKVCRLDHLCEQLIIKIAQSLIDKKDMYLNKLFYWFI